MSKRDGMASAAPRQGMKRNLALSVSAQSGNDLAMALQTLDEETMVYACSLLLSDRDYEDDAGEEESDYSKLLALFAKCNDAVKVVERHWIHSTTTARPASSLSAPPPTSSAVNPNARVAVAAPRSLKAHGHLNSMNPPRRMSSLQMSRTGGGVLAASRVKAIPAPQQRATLKRVPSDSSLASISSVSSNRSTTKKIRLQTTPTVAASNSETGMGTAPPPEALNFLQALNNQQSKQDDDEIPSPTEESRERHSRAIGAASTIKSPPGKRHAPRKRP